MAASPTKQIGVVAGAAIKRVITGAAFQNIVATTAAQGVIARLSEQRIVTRCTIQRVFTVAPVEHVGPVLAIQRIVAIFAIHPVGAVIPAVQGVGCRRAVNHHRLRGESRLVPNGAVAKFHAFDGPGPIAVKTGDFDVFTAVGDDETKRVALLFQGDFAGGKSGQFQRVHLAAALVVGGDRVVAASPTKQIGVVADTTIKRVITGAANQRVIPPVTLQNIVFAVAEDEIIACSAGKTDSLFRRQVEIVAI